MRPRLLSTTSALAALALASGAVALLPSAATAADASAPVVINEVYGGGGNSGATLRHDFVELYNPGDTAVDLSTWSVQYASSGGATWQTTPLTGAIAPHSTYVVREGAGAGGDTDVAGDVSGGINMSGTNGKVALVRGTTALTCGALGTCTTVPTVVDLVGYGSASDYLGSPAPAPSATASVTRDAAHTNTADNGADFTVSAPTPVACGSACVVTPPPPTTVEATIEQVQGTGAASPLAGSTVITKGVVTAAYPSGGFNGFYLQTAGTGGPADPATRGASSGVFVFAGDVPVTVTPGAYVQVTGAVVEFFGMTEINLAAAGDVVALPDDVAPVTATTTATWPRTEAGREALEGMLYRPTGAYTVTNTFATSQYGEVGLASGTMPLLQRTEVERPGPAASSAVEADNAARRVTLDDGASSNISTSNALTPAYVSQTEPVRVGAPVTFTDDVVVDYRNSTWKFQPTATVTGPDNAGSPATFTNTRTPAPDSALVGDGDIRIASFNVLNYFTTLGASTPGCTANKDRTGDGSTVAGGCDVRGAWDAADLGRQQAKIVKAINALDADVVGLMEVENSAHLGEPVDEALQTLVAALNADAGSAVWAANPSSTELPDAATRDVITSAIIYKPASVTRVGESRALGTQSGPGQPFDNAREPIAQVFAPVGGGSDLTFVVNHFKSKGSAGPLPGDADSGDGQGASNASRVAEAKALAAWVPTVTPAGTSAVALVGDFNSYAQEDPILALADAGYVDAETAFPHGEYSYSFSGLSGSLDHVLLNAAARGRATGADIWNINSGESVALEYSRYDYTPTDFYRPDPYRSSDHDPVVVGLRAAAAPVPVQVLATNDFHGRLSANGAEAGAAVLAGAVKQLRGAQPNTVFAAAGDLIGASTFESFIAKDKPTLDALNAAGLQVSAVGNHEFDRGYSDLVGRVMAPYDATTNPLGGAAWQYLGANVRKTDGSAALPETWTEDFGGITVGFVGAVTEHLPELVSPAGLEGVRVTSIVEAANRNADRLKAEGADVVVLLVHEGAATTELSSAIDPTSDFGKVVNGVDDNVDAIVSGHTHLAYNHAVPVPGWAGRPVTTRPVVSAGQYGTNLNQLLFSVDPDTEQVVGLQQALLPLVKNPAYPADPATKAVVDRAVADAATLGAATVGRITGPFNRAKLGDGTTENRGGESTLGNLVAEVQQTVTEAPESGAAQIAFMNPGGLRADLVGSGTSPSDVTYRQAANVQPFANTLVNMTLTGAQLKQVLEQQWQPEGAARPFLRLGISEGFTYTYDPAAAVGSHVTAMRLAGTPVTPTATYSVTVNSFLASGGDNFGAFAGGTGRRDTGKVDLQAMVDYLQARGTISPDPTQRSVGVHFPAGAPASYGAGDTVAFDLSSLAFSTAADAKDTSVSVTFAGTPVGTFPVDNTVGTAVLDEIGRAAVSFAVPAGTPAGTYDVVVTGAQTGTRAVVPVAVTAPAQVPTTTTVTSSASPSTFGTAVTFTATVSGGATSGTVQFAVDGDLVGAPVALVGGTATSPSLATLAVGTHTVTAMYSGDAGALGSTGSTTQVVEKAVVTVTVAKPAPVSVLGVPVRFTARVSAPAVAGTVQFLLDGKAFGSPVRLVDGKAVSAPLTNAAGAHRITANYSGDAGTLAATGYTSQAVQYVVTVLSPAPGAGVKAGSTTPVRFRLTDRAGVAIPDAEARALLAAPCRVKVAATGASALAPTCPTYNAGTDVFTVSWKVGQRLGNVLLEVSISYKNAPTQVVPRSVRIVK